MDGSLSQFKATLQRRKERQANNSEKFSKKHLNYHLSESKIEFGPSKLSKPELEQIKKGIRENLKAERRKGLLIFGVVFAIALFSLLYFLI